MVTIRHFSGWSKKLFKFSSLETVFHLKTQDLISHLKCMLACVSATTHCLLFSSSPWYKDMCMLCFYSNNDSLNLIALCYGMTCLYLLSLRLPCTAIGSSTLSESTVKVNPCGMLLQLYNDWINNRWTVLHP